MALTKVGGGILRQPIDVGIITATSVNVSGVVTASNFVGDVTGTASLAENLTGSPNISVTNINATGVITATSFIGDISQATGGAGGLGTALSPVPSNPLNKIYYVDNTLYITENSTVSLPNSALLNTSGYRVAYTNHEEVAVEDGFDFIIDDGVELELDILSLRGGF